jgi:hypothetical protein
VIHPQFEFTGLTLHVGDQLRDDRPIERVLQPQDAFDGVCVLTAINFEVSHDPGTKPTTFDAKCDDDIYTAD